MSALIHEPVAVVAVFKNGQVKPARFLWRGRNIHIDRIGLCWKTNQGMARIWHFSTVAEKTLYELTFDAVGLNWKLEAVEDSN